MKVTSSSDFVVHNFRTPGPSYWVNVSVTAISLPPAPSVLSEVSLSFNTEILADRNFESLSEHKDWGAPIGDGDDIFSLAELGEFQSTDLTYLSNTRPEIPTRGVPSTQAIQRTEVTLDLNYLHATVPQPHIHPSSSQDHSKPIKMVPYQKIEPIPIPPYALPLPPPSPYSRHAWLVPIRGAFPWKECTPAVMLESSIHVPSPTDPAKLDEPVKWTHASLRSFWTFLLSLKETHNVGSIGLSFHAARPPTRFSQSGSMANPALSKEGCQAFLASDAPSERRSARTATQPPTSRIVLSDVDHIKVYHEAQYTMLVRNALHIWSYIVQPVLEVTKPDKVRLLKGARLVLVDGRSKGILIS